MNKNKDKTTVTEWKSLSASDFYFKINDILASEDFSYSQLTAYADSNITDKKDVLDLVNNMIYAISEKDAITKSIQNEISDLQARKERFNNQSDYLRNCLKMIMDKLDVSKIEAPFGTVSKVHKKASRLEVYDEGLLLMSYPELYTKQEPKLDKVALKQLLQTGVEIEGVTLVDTETIQIRK